MVRMVVMPEEGLPNLIGVRCSHENDRAFLWNSPSSSWMHLPKEEVYQDRKHPEHQVVKPWYQQLVAALFLRHGVLLYTQHGCGRQ
jgi:hypothetical protein